MSRIEHLLENYLRRIQRLEPVTLGGDGETKVTREDNDYLKDLLIRQIAFNQKIIVIALVMLVLIFLLDLYLALHAIREPEAIRVAFNGAFTLSSLFLVINWLRRLWVEKSLMDVSLMIARDMPPEQAARYIGTVYWRIVNKKVERRLLNPDAA